MLIKLNKGLFNPWLIIIFTLALLFSIPILFVAMSVFVDSGEIWQHLASTVLKDYIINSILIMIGVGAGVLIIGVSTAWLVTMVQFPGRGMFEWALLLPLAAPAYLLAYTYTNMLDFFGPVQTTLRAIFGWSSVNDYWFPNIRSLPGAIALLILVLYPYVYLLVRVAFLEQSLCTLEASRSLGCNPKQSFLTVALPLARPSIIAGLALAEMEALNDFGTVSYFGVSTFTTGIYRTWIGMGEREAASQLAACLMVFILILLLLERWSRRQSRYYQSSSRYQILPRYQLKPLRAILAWGICALPVILGFLAPSLYLLNMMIHHAQRSLNENFWSLASNSLFLSSITAVIAVIISLIMAYGHRLAPHPLMNLGVRVAVLGYAVPGSVIAVGVLIPMGAVDNWLNAWLQANFNWQVGLLLTGTIAGLIFSYLVRFLAVAFGTVESSLNKIKPSLDDAARSLGRNSFGTLWEVHTPLLSGGMLTAAMLIFVDVMKELPATLILRPFNFDTLAIRVFQYASDERLVEAAAPALAIVLAGIVPVIFLSVKISQSRS